MGKATTSYRNVAEHLRTSEDMAAFLEACIEAANVDAELAPRMTVPPVFLKPAAQNTTGH
jgi:DNA-binding phage protein